MKIEAEEGVEEEAQIAPYFGGLDFIVFAVPSIVERWLWDVVECTVRAFGRESNKMLELELRLFDCEPYVGKEVEKMLIKEGESGDVVLQ